jgi:hypothetical protein
MESVGTLTWRGQDYESDFVAPSTRLVGSVPESVAESACSVENFKLRDATGRTCWPSSRPAPPLRAASAYGRCGMAPVGANIAKAEVGIEHTVEGDGTGGFAVGSAAGGSAPTHLSVLSLYYQVR